MTVHPHDSERLERRLLAESSRSSGATRPAEKCSQFLRHESVWVPLNVLDHWGHSLHNTLAGAGLPRRLRPRRVLSGLER